VDVLPEITNTWALFFSQPKKNIGPLYKNEGIDIGDYSRKNEPVGN